MTISRTLDYWVTKTHGKTYPLQRRESGSTAVCPADWKADLIENFRIAKEFDVIPVQGTVSDLFTPSFSPVKIYVPKASIQRARNLLKTFNEAQDESKE